MGNPLSGLFGGGSSGSMQRIPVADTPEQRMAQFRDRFDKIYGGNPSNPNNGMGNQAYRDSLSGYFNTPFQQIGGNLARVNAFMPRAKPQNFRYVYKEDDDNNDFMNFIPDPLDMAAPGAGFLARTSLF